MGLVEEETSPEFVAVAKEFREFQQQMKDPLLVGAMLNRLSEEKRSTNLVLKEINSKLEKLFELEERIKQIEQKIYSKAGAGETRQFLSEIDNKIMNFVKKRGKCCAEEIQKQFKYRGRNAASSRLNALWKQGLFDKKYAGKTVYFIPKQLTTSQDSQSSR